ncbi:hypothetical protein AB0L82_20820 [Nocardia sp. NPDC052001]|uniref:hypothetical protein n=1 Tax=Nocardia sp. NPDC052001 TaxID=3154853 RepID=UPI00342D0392
MSDRGIEYKPGMDDPKRVSMNRFLPQGVLRAEISYRKPGGLKGTRVVARSEAEFAVLRTAVREGYGEVWRKPEQLSLSEAEAYIKKVSDQLAQEQEEIKRRREAIDLSCPWCEQQRTYIGVLGLVTGTARWLSDRPSELSQQVINQHAYRCNLCGSMQFFADGYLEHPLPGRAAPEDRPPFG